MSEWAWADCPKCKSKRSVHINFKCVCGGDPWKISELAQKEIDKLNQEKDKLLTRVAEITKKIEYYKEEL